MLAELQNHLTNIYRVDPGYDVTDFLVTDPLLAKILGQDSLVPETAETVFLREEDDGVALSVYLDAELVSRLTRSNPLHRLRADQLNDFWTVLEGISHFNYIVWNAGQDRSVSLLELEMQAEVDKFVSAWLLALAQEGRAFADRLHGWLFDEVSFHPGLDEEQRERYEAANRYAARFCHGLSQRLHRDNRKGLDELRRFYRLSRTDKISHIHARAYDRF